jgi:magnesium-transporting ATPase (P-type)
MKNQWPGILGWSTLLAVVLVSFVPIEVASRYEIVDIVIRTPNQAKEQLNRAVRNFHRFLLIALAWAIGSIFIMYEKYGYQGSITVFILDIVVILWIYISYKDAFKEAAKLTGLDF